MDIWVKNSQHWLNGRYGTVSGFSKVTEDGVSGWQTMYALTRALQHELGLTALSDNFGAGTTAAFVSKVGKITSKTTSAGIIGILQCAFWCKGYSGDTTFGVWSSVVAGSLSTIRGQIGLSTSVEVDVKLMQSLLTLDAYILVSGGSSQTRAGQQWLNSRYTGRSAFSIVPCDGSFTRDVQRGLMLAIQYEIGMDDSTANGNFGPGTIAGIKAKGLVIPNQFDSPTSHWVTLFQLALTFNGYGLTLSGGFDTATKAAVATFQAFMEISASAKGDYSTWAALLVSTGDPARATEGFDTNTPVTAAFASTLKASGYTVALRYLTVAGKAFAVGELNLLLDSGFAVVPVFENSNNSAALFTHATGVDQGQQAAIRARQLGFHDGATIFFAVDYDAYDSEIDAYIAPFFRGIAAGLAISTTRKYEIGIYASRNVCSRIVSAGLAKAVWVNGMSSGFSGNQGFPMPKTWWYNQIFEDTSLNIDHDVVSVHAQPVVRSQVDRTPESTPALHDFYWNLAKQQVLAEQACSGGNAMASGSESTLVLFYLMKDKYSGTNFSRYTPWPPPGVAATTASADLAARASYEEVAGDPETYAAGYDGDIEHVGVVAQGVNYWGTHAGAKSIGVGDLGGWALDSVQLWANYSKFGKGGDIAAFVSTNLGKPTENTEWGPADVISDADGYLFGRDVLAGIDFAESVRTWLVNYPNWIDRTKTFLTARFTVSGMTLSQAIAGNITSVFTDPWPETLARKAFQEGVDDPSATQLQAFATAVANSWLKLVGW